MSNVAYAPPPPGSRRKAKMARKKLKEARKKNQPYTVTLELADNEALVLTQIMMNTNARSEEQVFKAALMTFYDMMRRSVEEVAQKKIEPDPPPESVDPLLMLHAGMTAEEAHKAAMDATDKEAEDFSNESGIERLAREMDEELVEEMVAEAEGVRDGQ